MPFCTPLALMAFPCLAVAASDVEAATATEETAPHTTTPTPLAGHADAPLPPDYGGYPVDALFNFGAIRDLFATRRNF